MDKIIYFNIAALALIIVMFVSIALRKLTRNRTCIFLVYILIDMFLAIVFGTMGNIIDNMHTDKYEVLQFIGHFGYLLFHNLTSLLYILYIIVLTDTFHHFKKRKIQNFLVAFPMLLLAVLLVTSIFNGVLISIEDGEYVRGFVFPIVYVIGAFYLIYGIYYIYKYRDLFSFSWIVTLFAFYPLIIASMVIEYIYPQIMIELFANTLGILFIYLNIERPADIVDGSTGFFNANTFYERCERSLKTQKEVLLIYVNLKDASVIFNILGVDNWNILVKQIGKNLVNIYRQNCINPETYYLGNAQFRIALTDNELSIFDGMAMEIEKSILNIKAVNGIEIDPKPIVCKANLQRDFKTRNDLILFQNKFKTLDKPGIMNLKDVVSDKYYRVSMEIDKIIDRAIKGNLFDIYYQPIYSLKKEGYVSCEALLRYYDNTYGYISPDIIIKAAEQNGAINKIGEYVLRKVCHFITMPEFETLGLEYIEVNLSVVQCIQANYAETLTAIIDSYNIDHKKINFEITETALALDNEIFTENMRKLSEAGFSISIDDFGNGYSNFRRLMSLPVNIAKVDKSLVDVSEDEKVIILLRSIVGTFKGMGLDVVIEGVEKDSQVEFFRKIGADYIQGYYYSRPLSQFGFTNFIKKVRLEKDIINVKE